MRRWLNMPTWWLVPALVIAASGALSLGKADETFAVQPINFTRGTVQGAGFTTSAPGSLEFGPDGKLYVADTSGRIQQLTLDPVTKQVTSVLQITSATDLQEVYGIAFDLAAPGSPKPLYVTNTISGFGDMGQAPAGSFPGKITKLSGTNYATRTDVITGLPVSNSGHEANGLTFGPDGKLYIAQGGTTNAGVINPNGGLFQREEVPTGGAVLVAAVNQGGFNGNITYNPPNTYSSTVQQTGGDVSVYASGLRNPYDLLFHSNGKLYLTDNGPNAGYGPGSLTCSSVLTSDAQAADELNIIVAGAYYGHPNRNRGATDPRQCTYHPGTDASGGGYTAPIGLLGPSTDGMAEYKYGGFGGQMQGDLLAVGWVDGDLRRIELSGDGNSVVSNLQLADAFNAPLDVAVAPDGTIFVAEYLGNKITFMKPDESAVTGITVTDVSPSVGPTTGGQLLTILGTNFTTTADTSVTVDGTALTGMVVHNSGKITGTTQGHAAATVDVVVTNSVGAATVTGGYTYSTGGGASPPVADAGDDWSGPIAHNDHAHVTLDATGSFDPDSGGYITAWEWKEGTTVLSTNEVDSVQFTLGEHFVTLTVTDDTNDTDTDVVRVVVTQFAENPDPWYCFDVNNDQKVNSIDLSQVAQQFNKKFGQAGYTRLKDFNADRTINSIDLMGTAQDFTTQCPLVDMQIRAAIAGTEQYNDVNYAISQGFYQATPYIPGQGRHMVRPGPIPGGENGGHDTVFEPHNPESLLYEPIPTNTPGESDGWRLGGLMYIIPESLSPLPPAGFAGNEDAWHYHLNLCIWNNGQAVQENVPQATCLSRPGNPVWNDKAGWLVHIWAFYPNYQGRFVEVNNDF